MKSIKNKKYMIMRLVAPYAGAWIEMLLEKNDIYYKHVAPYAGAWIEILPLTEKTITGLCRSLRGSVD